LSLSLFLSVPISCCNIVPVPISLFDKLLENCPCHIFYCVILSLSLFPINYYLDLCVDTYVVNNRAVLLRLHDKYNYWGAPGGHIDPGEDVNEAALREVWEEVGLKVELVAPYGWIKNNSDHNIDLVPPMFVNRHKITDTHDHSAFIFAARSDSRELNPQSSEDIASASKCVWVTKEELDELIKKDERLGQDTYKYALAALSLTN
jgi:8-oxo-dGTP pyrophosphatase MutT (NUDIX family)